MSGKSVEVICPNARRQKVKIDGATTVVQILQTVCQKQGFDDRQYDLKFQRKILDVTGMVRFLNIPNNAKLEMVPATKPRTASSVVVALQLDDGSRKQHEFDPTISLYSMLQHFDENTGAILKPESVITYMRQEYRGTDSLQTTTLAKMGLLSGRAAFRLLFREVEEPMATASASTSAESTSSTASTDLAVNTSPMMDVEMSSNQSSPTKSDHATSNNRTQQLEHSPITPGRGPAVKKSKLADDVPKISATKSATKQADVVSAATSSIGLSIFPQDNLPSVPQPRPQVDLTPQLPPQQQTNEFIDFKFPERPNQDEDVAIDPNQLRQEVRLSMECDRQTVVYRIDELQDKIEEMNSRGDQLAHEPDDNFFNVTVEDLRSRMNELKSAVRHRDEGMLMTKAMREQREIERISAFEKVAIRVHLPEKVVLQGLFRPLETVGALKKFVQSQLNGGSSVKFDLFTTPPRTLLRDMKQTLHKAQLVPAANVHVSSSEDVVLKPEIIKQTFVEAEAVLKYAVDSSKESPSDTSASDQAPQQARSSRPPQSASSSSNRTQPKNAPRWFKSGR